MLPITGKFFKTTLGAVFGVSRDHLTAVVAGSRENGVGGQQATFIAT